MADHTRKPILDWDTGVLKERMRGLGFDEVEFLGKPVTFKNLRSMMMLLRLIANTDLNMAICLVKWAM